MRVLLTILIIGIQSLNAQISAPVLQKLQTESAVDVLIELRQQADLSSVQSTWTKERKARFVYNILREHAEFHQAELRSYLDLHLIRYRSFYLVNAISARVSKQELYEISSLPSVGRISLDVPTPSVPTRDTRAGLVQMAPQITWGLARVGADKAWAQGIEGKGTVVGGCDTGIKWDIPAIAAQYRGNTPTGVDHNYNWHDAIHQNSPLSGPSDNPCGLNLKAPCDDHGHGTHTIGTMVGLTPEFAIGMAPKAEWIGCRNMERGNGAPSTYIECFEFFLAPYDLNGMNPLPEKSPHVINNSWYCSLEEGCDTSVFPIMELVVDHLKTSGIVVVVSAGNDGAACNTLRNIPAIYKNSFTVGSIQANSTISGFSSNGPVNNYRDIIVKPNVVAPGSDVLSMLPDSSYAFWSGTSMAGPHVAGLVALLISANPVIAGHVEQIETIIEESAERLTADFDCFPSTGMSIPNNTYGFGLINVEKAVEKAKLAVGLNNQNKDMLSIFPNPVKHKMFINNKSPNSTDIFIRDILGRQILQQSISAGVQELRISDLQAGIYFIQNNQNNVTLPFIKMD
jgi:serine protease AprX